MVITTSQKLQLLILIGCLAIGCYFYILHKDLERVVGDLHERVQYLLKLQSNALPTTVTISAEVPGTVGPSATAGSPVPATATVAVVGGAAAQVNADDDADDDAASVTSNDIKDLLTNIYDADADADTDGGVDAGVAGASASAPAAQVDEPTVSVEVAPEPPVIDAGDTAPPPTPNITTKDIGTMSDSEILKAKYDDLRAYLRKHGVVMKGSKQEMLAKIREINAGLSKANAQ